jgi:CheY-like chemotaxis protein
LIVDDEEDIRELYAWCLRAAGWLVEECANAEEAFFVAPDFQPDVIVMDHRLPGLSGIDAIRRIKRAERTKHVPVVACTGADRSKVELMALHAGCAAFVAKPCSPDDLRELLEQLVCT